MPSPFPGMDPYLEDPGIWPDFVADIKACVPRAKFRSLKEHGWI